jgi:hypothetical protein
VEEQHIYGMYDAPPSLLWKRLPGVYKYAQMRTLAIGTRRCEYPCSQLGCAVPSTSINCLYMIGGCVHMMWVKYGDRYRPLHKVTGRYIFSVKVLYICFMVGKKVERIHVACSPD